MVGRQGLLLLVWMLVPWREKGRGIKRGIEKEGGIGKEERQDLVSIHPRRLLHPSKPPLFDKAQMIIVRPLPLFL